MSAVWRMSWMEAKFFMRERQAVFWTFFLPAFMLVFFGTVFRGPGYVEFLVAGLIGMNLMATALFSVGTMLVGYRERGILRRLRVTPLTPAAFIAAHVLNRYVLGLIQAGFLLMLGYWWFGVAPHGSLATLFVIVTVGLLSFMALGFTISGMARHRASASGIANVIFIPALFLGGAYFPVDSFPSLLRTVGSALPLAPFLAAFRDVYGVGRTLADVTPSLLTVGAWGAAGTLLSVRFFRWE